MVPKVNSSDFKKCVYFLLILFISYDTVIGNTVDDVERILNDVFDSSRYNKLIRGQHDLSKPMNITVGMTMKSIVEVHEIKEYVQLLSVIHITWQDDRLTWNSSDYNNTDEVFITGDLVWHPEVYVEQASQEQHMIGDITRHPIMFMNTGHAIWTTVVPLTIACSFDLTAFPWDIQTCNIRFMVWGYLKRHIHVQTSMSAINMEHYVENSVWEFLSSHVCRDDKGIKSGIAFRFVIRRRADFFIINVFLPIVCLSLLCLLVFAIPIESGERISFSLTTLLTVVLFMSLMGSIIPPSAETIPTMCYFLFAELMKSLLVCACNIWSLKCYNTPSDGQVPGKGLRKLATIFRSCANGRHKKVHSFDRGIDHSHGKDLEGETTTSFNTDTFEIDWKDVSKALDRLFAVIMVLFSIICYAIVVRQLVKN
ncbi:Neuronal acetylcholine receptor subunit alpha-7 [Mactra antiquata]